tara:strand:- start:380 stop:493 length:114 start_codon:yes stop_codon:yes gene_type:complete
MMVDIIHHLLQAVAEAEVLALLVMVVLQLTVIMVVLV